MLWRNASLTNGFSCLVVSQGRAFTLISKQDAGGRFEYCVGLDAATGTELWATPIGVAPWDPAVSYNGGAGTFPYVTGDGPRTTPCVASGRVVALSGRMNLVGLNATNGSVVWSNNLKTAYGASEIAWENGASPCLDQDLVFVNLNTAADNRTLAAFRIADGSLAWSSQNEGLTHATPVVATIEGVRQVIFPTVSGLVSLERNTGALLWKFAYPFGPISTSMGAGPVVYSNLVYCTAAYFRGAAAARITYSNSTWTVTQLYYKNSSAGLNYRSIWMTPVCHEGYVYTLCGENSSFLTPPLNCIELSTGELKWSTNNFGMGGLILVDTNLVVLTEDGQVVLARATPAAYHELARYRAFDLDAANPGKCWNNPTYADGRLYARSTRGGIALDVSVPLQPPLTLLPPRFLNSTQLQLVVSTANGTTIPSNRLPKIEVRSTNSLGGPPLQWPRLTNPLVLAPDGLARLTNTVSPGGTRQFFQLLEQP
ncbi:MAG TPA: PQQ-binding-like beta-propeller repeat protein [Candidatus Paceibacterota bacterium]|nr:PQQ-binding-like beta-propeller repeat protein [Candidatus Paceibacterota bacterium]